MDESVEQFMALSGCKSEEEARFFLESAGNDVAAALNFYMETSGGGAVSASDAAAALDAGPAADAAGAPAASTPGPAGSGAADDDDPGQRWYTGGGGGGTGQQVIAPGQGGPKKLEAFMESLRTKEFARTEHGGGSSSKGAFTGTARTLDGQIKPAKEAKKHTVKLYANDVFTVNDGPPRHIRDPANMAFLNAMEQQRCPDELQSGEEEVEVSVVTTGVDYTPEAQPRPAFTGTGQKLGTAAPKLDGPSAAAFGSEAVATVWNGPSEDKPTTSIQIRLPDGSRLVGRFNHDQPVKEIRAFIAAVRPAEAKQPYTLSTGYPQKVIEDETVSVEAAGLINAVVLVKR